ncbi:anthranilate/aminodeoxychorismate synthase component II [Halorientalis sp. IM1011]|uniref:anthranilate synthase component II n=1 Tax=Halorientalis sp. IM1011 TaxID=1932360 RepID=UPI00097CC8DD|nr:aminodeoxychorismate/anthranilate synthase component II [Halorientalis sp. IM1011]AQL41905.1 anthranilate/aminodeoxychorismate synthase component II [Halorientalis sp. IM1011]
MKVLVIDNYDSFAYNLVQYVGEIVTDPSWGIVDDPDRGEVIVRRNDRISVEGIRDVDPDGIVVSPGPGIPEDAGVSVPIFSDLAYPTLGVCLGHQALCSANGAPVGHAEAVVHGKPSTVEHDGRGLFADLPDRFEVGRYHSLAVEHADLPDELDETAWTVDGGGEAATDDPGDPRVVMGVRHRERPHYGVQFHPESILTDAGKRLIAAFCDRCQHTPTT